MSSQLGADVAIDTRQLVRYARDMTVAADPNLNREFGKAIQAAAAPTVATAKELASWSLRIPATIRATGGATRVVIRAGGDGAPHARPYEGGSRSQSFRHPVFGRNVWVAQTARPFLKPAQIANLGTTRRLVEDGVMSVLREAGYA